ncbi:MAG: plasmid encoded RepA protein [Acidobacteria bacterium]|nr:plasmid encoded RepA protein [Acidobacteriota bacterium]
MSDEKKHKPLTRATFKLLDASAVIYGEHATKQDAAFIARELIQATLPHKNPGNVPVWTRTNGNLTLIVQQGHDRTGKPYGYPHGTVPRLLLFWMTTEALRNKAKENPHRLHLGKSLKEFMLEIGLNPDNGSRGAKRSDARRLNDQMHRLFNATISFEADGERNGRGVTARRNMLVADDVVFWWDVKAPQQGTLWDNYIVLSSRFYEAITAAPVPVDVRALRALKSSALALDLYSWLTYEAYRAHKSGKPRFETWEQLQGHMGGEYSRIDNFRTKAKAALRKIQVVYPLLKLGDRQGGITVLPESLPALQPRQSITIDGKSL